MEAFIAIRKRARERRDKLINQARAEYDATIERIGKLEQDILGKYTSRHVPTSVCVNRVIPADKPFSLADIMEALQEADDTRDWVPDSVSAHVYRLYEKGYVRRVRKARGRNIPALYIRAEVPTEDFPAIAARGVKEIVIDVLRAKGGQTISDVTVAMIEMGYDAKGNPKSARSYVSQILWNNSDTLFKVDGKRRWSLRAGAAKGP